MTNRFTMTAPGSQALSTERSGRQRGRWRFFAGLFFAVAFFSAAPAGAQEAAEPAPAATAKPPADSGIEEIIVRGAESEATADFESADSVTGFGAEDLAALGAQDIADIAAFTPNLEIVTSGATTPTFFIRGVGLNDFNSNSTGAVAIYRDDVPINAPALQLSTLFDVEAVNVLRGPQGSGLARNASAGAIKMYSRKPTGEYGAYLRTDFGNFHFRDFEGALETPIYEDILAARFAFRYTQREGTMKNRCGNAPPEDERGQRPRPPNSGSATDPEWSICNEPVLPQTFFDPDSGFSDIPTGLADYVNDLNNWAARGTILFQPTLDMTWLLNGHGSRRDELTRLGQSYGTRGFYCVDNDVDSCFGFGAEFPEGSRINGLLGGSQAGVGGGYVAPEVTERKEELAPCFKNGTCLQPENQASADAANQQVANELAQGLDSKPWEGDFNRTGPTTNDTWGAYLNGNYVLPWGMELTSVTGYDGYDRTIDIDLDFSPQTLFHIITEDEGWQVAQDLKLAGRLDEFPLTWDIGAWFLRENLDVGVSNDLGVLSGIGVASRQYEQNLYSAAGYAHLSFDFWEDFTIDGGVRYNWERKKIDFALTPGSGGCRFDPSCAQKFNETWSAPTGTVRLTYRFREDTHVFWKYTRGWKPGTFNATGSPVTGVTTADPETIDAFEAGVRGSWFEGRLGLDTSFFYYSYTDYQIFTAQQFIGSNPEFVILNANDAEVYGAEADIVGRPWAGMFVNVRFAWLESQFLDFLQVQQELAPGGTVILREIQNSGNPLLNSPQFKVTITGEQTLPLGRWGSITARYDGTWTDTTYFDATEGRGIPNSQNIQFLPEETIAQPSHWIHNVRLSYRPPGGRVELAVWGRNLANTAVKSFAFDASTFNNTSIYFVGDPRTIGGSFSLNW